MKIISGTAHRALAERIANSLGQSLAAVHVSAFPDGETEVKINENVRGEDVFIIQPSCPPTNHNIMELLILVDAARRASAGRITAVMPFFGYARQDRKDQPRVPITAKLVANLLTSSGVNRVLTVDALGAELAIVAKHRVSATRVEAMNVIGEVEGRDVLLVDDMTETAGTLCAAADILHKHGAKRIYAGVSHAILGPLAHQRILDSAIEEVITTDTVPQATGPKVQVVGIGPLLAEAIKRINGGQSVTSLFAV